MPILKFAQKLPKLGLVVSREGLARKLGVEFILSFPTNEDLGLREKGNPIKVIPVLTLRKKDFKEEEYKKKAAEIGKIIAWVGARYPLSPRLVAEVDKLKVERTGGIFIYSRSPTKSRKTIIDISGNQLRDWLLSLTGSSCFSSITKFFQKKDPQLQPVN